MGNVESWKCWKCWKDESCNLKAHSKDTSCGDYSHELGLIATGGRDNKVRVWEYEKMKFIDEKCIYGQHKITSEYFTKWEDS